MEYYFYLLCRWVKFLTGLISNGMKIIIPMAGLGSRFLRAGYNDPKPLIKVNGKPIIEHVINLFPGEEDFVFICRREHLEKTNLREILLTKKPKGKILEIEGSKLGPVFNVSLAFQYINDNEPIIVNYCDFFMDWDYDDFKKTVLKNNCDGSIPAYKGYHPHLLHDKNFYASMLVDNNNFMQEIKEKHSYTINRMDTPQSVGTYYFKKGEYIKKYFTELMNKNINLNGEYYVSLVYNLMKADGKLIYIYDKIPHFLQLGTPDDLEEYKYWAEIFSKASYGKH